jgi:DNA polymerase-3 subunit beta
VVPVLAGLRLEAGDGLTLSCFDYELAATARVAADVAEPGTALVPGRLLAEITRSLPGQPAEFAADGDVVGLTCGSAEFALVSLPLADYPELPPTPPLAGTIDGGELAAAVAQVLPAASRDDTLPMLTTICRTSTASPSRWPRPTATGWPCGSCAGSRPARACAPSPWSRRARSPTRPGR